MPGQRIKVLIILVVLAAVSVGGFMLLRPREKGDPAAISRDFILAIWQGDEARLKALSCDDDLFQQAMLREARQADPTVTVDASGLTFSTYAEADDEIVIQMGGTVVFTSQEGAQVVRNLEEEGVTYFTLRDDDGWKVCNVR